MGVMAGHQVKLIKRAHEELKGAAKPREKAVNLKGAKVESGYGEGDVFEYATEP